MSGLQNYSSHLLKYTRLFNDVCVARLCSNTAMSSFEMIQRERKVSANNYHPSPVAMSRGKGYHYNSHYYFFVLYIIL